MSDQSSCHHKPNTTCEVCGLPVDQYGNTENSFDNCSFPDCGCDGARLCMAKSGPNEGSNKCNVEGMYQRTDCAARQAKGDLVVLCNERRKENCQ